MFPTVRCFGLGRARAGHGLLVLAISGLSIGPSGALAAQRAAPREALTVGLQAPLPVARDGAAATAVDGRLLVAGGETAAGLTGQIDVLDARTGQWTRLTDDVVPRRDHGLAVVGRTLILVGGSTAVGPTDIVELVDLDSGRVAIGPRLPTPRVRPGVAAWNGRVFVAGGRLGFGAMSVVEVLDLEGRTWLRSPMLARASEPVLVVAAGKLFAISPPALGRQGSSLIEQLGEGGRFVAVAEVPARGGFGAAASLGNEIVLLDATEAGDAVVWDALEESFRRVAGAVVVPDGAAVAGVAGHVLVVGGVDADGALTDAAVAVLVP